MPSYDYVTVGVFTAQRFSGNPLAVFPDASGLTDAPVRPALSGTLQAALSEERARLARFTRQGAPNIPSPMLAALCQAPFEG